MSLSAIFTESFGWFQSNHYAIKRIDPHEIKEKQLKYLSSEQKNQVAEKSLNKYIFSTNF